MTLDYSFCYTADPRPIHNPACSYRTDVTPERSYLTNADGKRKYLEGGKNYPIRIIRNNFKDLASTNFFFTSDVINNINTNISTTESYYLNYPNGIKQNYKYIPEPSTYSQLTNNIAFIDKKSTEYACKPGDFGSKIIIGTNNNSITVTCGDGENLQTSTNNLNDYDQINGFTLRIYPIDFFNNFNYINDPKNNLVAQVNGITDLSSMRNAIEGLITDNFNFNDYMYEWTGIIQVPTTGSYYFKLICQETEGNVYLWIGDDVLLPTISNYFINDNINAIITIPATSVQVPIPCDVPPPCIQFDEPYIRGGTKNYIQSSGLNYTIVTFTKSTSTPKSITFNGFTYCDILVVGGGGGGGGDIGGGGGGGQVIYQELVKLSAGTYTIIVGNGGTGSPPTVTNTNNSTNGNRGTNSSISLEGLTTINDISFSASGGYGGYSAIISSNNKGGNGGANGSNNNSTNGSITSYSYYGGGGGGSDINTGSASGKNGGNGFPSNITGNVTYYGAGGGGGAIQESGGIGGSNTIGGNGNYSTLSYSSTSYPIPPETGIQDPNHDGKQNTGSGGGGGGYNYSPSTNNYGGNGAHGIVIIRYVNIQNGTIPSEPQLPSIQNQSLNSVNSSSPTPTTPVPILQIPIPIPLPIANVNPISISNTNYSYMIFTSPTATNYITFRVVTFCNVLIVGGGGPGGPRINDTNGGGGGGGGVKEYTFTFQPGTYNITIGAGGISGTNNNGGDSSISASNISTIIAGGGGSGGYNNSNNCYTIQGYNDNSGGCNSKSGFNGSSGGGSRGSNGNYYYGGYAYTNNNSIYPNFGKGGLTNTPNSGGGGGSGGNAYKINSDTESYINGGPGTTSHIIGIDQIYGSGGAGTNGIAAAGGGNFGSNGVNNTGGGGGGNGGNGGSGVIIISYSNVF